MVSESKCCGFESRLIHITRWKWSTFKKPGSIPTHNSGSFVEIKNIGSQMGQADKKKHYKNFICEKETKNGYY